MDNKNKRTQKKFQGKKDEESRSLLSYEGGSKKSKKTDKKEEEEEDPKHCGCCKYTTAITLYAILLWILGILILFDICTGFANKYFPVWYPVVALFLFFIFLAGLVLITSWFCKDSSGTRTSLKTGGWLILGSTIALIFWAIIYVWSKNSAEHQDSGDSESKVKTHGMKKGKVGLAQVTDVNLGTGDDDDDYVSRSDGYYIGMYLIWGAVILTFDGLLIYAAF